MAIIKSYTDISQAKILAEILPHDTADMSIYEEDVVDEDTGDIVTINITKLGNDDNAIPCWSLAALLGVLPRIDIEKEVCSDDTYDYRVKAYVGDGYVGEWHDNPIDACVELILKLYELKRL